MKILCVFLILIAIFSLQAQAAVRQKRQDLIEHDDKALNDTIEDDESTEGDETIESEEDDLADRHFGSKWGKKPGGWHKGPCGKPGRPPCHDNNGFKPKPKPTPESKPTPKPTPKPTHKPTPKPTPKPTQEPKPTTEPVPTLAPSDEMEEPTKTEPTPTNETPSFETRPTFATTEATDPTPKPTSKPTPEPTTEPKPTSEPGPTLAPSDKTEEPTKTEPTPNESTSFETRPTFATTEATNPTPKPTSKPTSEPTTELKPTFEPGPTLAPSNETEEPIKTEPTPTESTSFETRPTFATTEETKPTPKPTSKPTSEPTTEPKPTSEPGPTLAPSDETDEPTKTEPTPTESTSFETRPTFMTTDATDPTPKPTDPTKPPRPKPPTNPGDGSGGGWVFPGDEGVWKPPSRPGDTPKPKPGSPNKQEIEKCMSKCYVTLEDLPVCGNNGVTYFNPSHFTCAKNCGADVKSYSQGPCSTDPCPTDPKGSLDALNQCLQKCPVTADSNPVCGTDGLTYPNQGRLLCSKRCGIAVDVLSRGPCSGINTNPPLSKTDEEDTTRPNDGYVIRQCIRNCPVTAEFSPVCGTNGVTYSNPGRLICAKSCGVDVETLSVGPCHIVTRPTELPLIPATPPSIVARACLSRCPVTNELNPVCGTDLITYINSGHLYCAQYCGSDVKTLSKGPCEGLTPRPTEPSKEEDVTNPASPVTPATPSVTPSSVARECMYACPSTPEYNPVCGTDYVTYTNPGRLHCAQKCGVAVDVLRHGPCPKRPPNTPTAPVPPVTPSSTTTESITSTSQSAEIKKCIQNRCVVTPEYNPVCGTDYVTYRNPGLLICAKEVCGANTKMLRHGPCPKRAVANAS